MTSKPSSPDFGSSSILVVPDYQTLETNDGLTTEYSTTNKNSMERPAHTYEDQLSHETTPDTLAHAQLLLLLQDSNKAEAVLSQMRESLYQIMNTIRDKERYLNNSDYSHAHVRLEEELKKLHYTEDALIEAITSLNTIANSHEHLSEKHTIPFLKRIKIRKTSA